MIKKLVMSIAALAFVAGAAATLPAGSAHATFMHSNDGRAVHGATWRDRWQQKRAAKMARKCAWLDSRLGWRPSKCAAYHHAAPVYSAAPVHRSMK